MSKFYVHDNGIAPNVAPAMGFYGEPVTATAPPNSSGANIAQATWSTAPYKPPARRERDSEGKKLCSFEGCRAWPSKKAGGDYCVGHARSLGVAPTCARADCKGAVKGDTKFCKFHQPKMPEPVDGDAS